jgi:putative aminopeptidase FrvX
MLMKNMRKQLIELLNIHGISGQETEVRSYLKPILEDLMDDVTIDTYGNLLATKTIGTGKGATVLLSAHMDTVRGVLKDRKLIENNGVITSDQGALGADDRAGIAIILTVLRNLHKLSFNGTVKVAFSREEEIGCKGAEKIDPAFYQGTDLAIVVDRKGNRDIVAGCGMAFCSDSVGLFMEDVAKMTDMGDWKCVEGGISDAMVFAQEGINSINLSAGYKNEHTDKEYVVLSDMKDTTRLILQVFAVINTFCHTFEEVGYENRWAKSWYGKSSKKSSYSGGYFEDQFEDSIWAEEYDQNGDVYVYEIGKDVVIQQGDQEIMLSRESLKSLVDQLKNI